jgi:tetratricopeptide (TPR) repeat protein
MGESRNSRRVPKGERSAGNTPAQWLLGAAGGILVIVPPVWFLGVPAVSKADAERAVVEVDRAHALIGAGRADEALAPLERSRQLNPKSFAAHNNLCVAHGILAHRDDAVAACQRALEIEPNNQLAKNNLMWVSSIAAPAAR